MTETHSPDAVHARAPGKINVSLTVGAVMDDGYHEVATAYQSVSLYEDVRAWHADDFSVSFTGPIDTTGVPLDATNLAIKAARLLARKAKYRGGVRLEIEKHVPVAGGMGGGSADAAATLVACDALSQAIRGPGRSRRLLAVQVMGSLRLASGVSVLLPIVGAQDVVACHRQVAQLARLPSLALPQRHHHFTSTARPGPAHGLR